MKYSTVALKEKILEMYPEIGQYELLLGIVFSEDKDAYVLTLNKGSDSLTTHLAKKDADECMEGIKCVYLGMQVAEFLKNYARRRLFSHDAA